MRDGCTPTLNAVGCSMRACGTRPGEREGEVSAAMDDTTEPGVPGVLGGWARLTGEERGGVDGTKAAGATDAMVRAACDTFSWLRK